MREEAEAKSGCGPLASVRASHSLLIQAMISQTRVAAPSLYFYFSCFSISLLNLLQPLSICVCLMRSTLPL